MPKIDIDFPYAMCERCNVCDLDTVTSNLYAEDKQYSVIRLKCRNGYICRDIVNNIVKCRDCEHGTLNCLERVDCDLGMTGMHADGFCSNAVRREGKR